MKSTDLGPGAQEAPRVSSLHFPETKNKAVNARAPKCEGLQA